MAVRPPLLFLCQTLPYPPDGGVWIRTYHVLRLLARVFDVTALCFERAQSASTYAHDPALALQALGRHARVELFAIPQKHSRVRLAWDHFRSLVFRRVYTEFVYDSHAFRRRLTELLDSTAFDVVHVDSLVDLVRYLPLCRDVPIICAHHDVESDLLRRRATLESRWGRRAYLRFQARLMEAAERRWCARVALNVAVSSHDRAALQRIAPTSHVTVVPNGVDVDEFRPTPVKGTGAAFVGGISWFPNRDALEFFCAQILPHLRALRPNVPVRWIGAASPEDQRRYAERHEVELTGYVRDAIPLMQDAGCHIVPLRAGGGTRLKILNAWAMGKPVVSTSIGCEGLAAVDGDNILIRDEPASFAKAIVDVLEDDALRLRLGERGRDTVERLYGWDVIGQGMIDTYLGIARKHRRDAASTVRPVHQEDSYRARR